MSKTSGFMRCLLFAAALGLLGMAAPSVPGLSFVSEAIAEPMPGDVDENVSVLLQPDKLPMKGNLNALVTIVEVSDFQCPFCSRAESTIAEIMKTYPKDVRVVFVHMPLPFHVHARSAAKAAHAAFLQGKFWEMHTFLFLNQTNLSEDLYISAAQKLGLDVNRFKSDYASEKTENFIKKCVEDASKHQVEGTPSFFINGELFVGAQPFSAFKEKIDNAIQRAKNYKKEKKLSGNALYKALFETAPKPVSNDDDDDNDGNDVARRYIEDGKSPVWGKSDAPITMIAYMDFQCPYSAKTVPTLDELMNNNPGKLRIVFKHMPIPYHANAQLAHQAAEAAKNQKKFWEYYRLLFDNQNALKRDDLINYARQLKLNEKKFIRDMNSNQTISAIKNDQNSDGTPTFYINGKKILGAQPIETFQKAIDEELATIKAYQKQNPKSKKLTGQKLYHQLAQDSEFAAARIMEKLTDGAPFKGPKNAPVTIVEFSDFQCPFCARATATMKKIIEKPKYKNKIRLVFKQYPLPFHENAQKAAEAALYAHQYGKFWEMHDLLFNNQHALDIENLLDYGEKLGMDREDMRQALDDVGNDEIEDTIAEDMEEGKALNVEGTPTFVINGIVHAGAVSEEQFEKIIDEELKKSKPKKGK